MLEYSYNIVKLKRRAVDNAYSTGGVRTAILNLDYYISISDLEVI